MANSEVRGLMNIGIECLGVWLSTYLCASRYSNSNPEVSCFQRVRESGARSEFFSPFSWLKVKYPPPCHAFQRLCFSLSPFYAFQTSFFWNLCTILPYDLVWPTLFFLDSNLIVIVLHQDGWQLETDLAYNTCCSTYGEIRPLHYILHLISLTIRNYAML